MHNDQTYIIDLCDRVLQIKGKREQRFDFLLGDPGSRGTRARLPIDAYYPSLNLVIEYHERQHSEPVKIMDRRIVASGITRGEQRKLYDQRRLEVLPQHGIKVAVFDYKDFEYDAAKRLRRTPGDLDVVRRGLMPFFK